MVPSIALLLLEREDFFPDFSLPVPGSGMGVQGGLLHPPRSSLTIGKHFLFHNQKWYAIAFFKFLRLGGPCRGICGPPHPLQSLALAKVHWKRKLPPAAAQSWGITLLP